MIAGKEKRIVYPPVWYFIVQKFSFQALISPLFQVVSTEQVPTSLTMASTGKP